MLPDNRSADHAEPAPRPTSPVLLLIAWMVVGIPAAWGVSQTVRRSLDLFRAPPASTQPAR